MVPAGPCATSRRAVAPGAFAAVAAAGCLEKCSNRLCGSATDPPLPHACWGCALTEHIVPDPPLPQRCLAAASAAIQRNWTSLAAVVLATAAAAALPTAAAAADDGPVPQLGVARACLASFSVFVCVLFANLLKLTDNQVLRPTDKPAEVDPATEAELALLLSKAIKFKTVSHDAAEAGRTDRSEFAGIHRFLEASFPLVHKTLAKKVVNEWSLCYEWEGSEPELAPYILAAHLDVVPVPVASGETAILLTLSLHRY